MKSSSGTLQQRIAEAKNQLEQLKNTVKQIKTEKFTTNLHETLRRRSLSPPLPNIHPLRCRRHLEGHFGKVYSAHWAGDSVHFVSASQDGKLLVWNGITTNKILSIPLKSSWVIACAYEQTANRFVVSGGLDNICSIYKLGNNKVMRVAQELAGHAGYISSFCFLSERHLISGSGDSTANYWDTETGKVLTTLSGHAADVMSVAKCPTAENSIATGSCDTTVKLFDLRTSQCSHTFSNHSADINSVTFMNDGYTLACGSDDSTISVIDIRSAGPVGMCRNERINTGITSVSFSKSGRLLFAAYEDFMIRGWDITTATTSTTSPAMTLSGHEGRVSVVGVNPEGDALMSGSWDTFLKLSRNLY